MLFNTRSSSSEDNKQTGQKPLFNTSGQGGTGVRRYNPSPVGTPSAPPPQTQDEGSALSAVGRFARAIPRAVVQAPVNFSQFISSGLGANNELNRQLQREAESRSDVVAAIARSNASPERKRQALAQLNQEATGNIRTIEQIQREASKRRGVAAGGEIIFDLATLGTGGAALKAGRAGSKAAVAGRKVARGAAEGAAAGAFGALQEDDISASSVARSAGIGAAFGGGLASFAAGAPVARRAVSRAGEALDSSVARTGRKIISESPLGSRIGDQVSRFREAWVDSTDALTRTLKDVKDETFSVGSRVVNKGEVARRKILRAAGADGEAQTIINLSIKNPESAQADAIITDLYKTVKKSIPKDRLDANRDFVNAKQNLTGYDGGPNPGLSKERLEEARKIVANATEEDKVLDNTLQSFYKELADRRFAGGLLDEDTHKLFTSNDYVRVQREIAEEITAAGGGAPGSVKTLITGQKRKGSNLQEIDPIATAVDYYVGTYGELLRNDAAVYAQKALEEANAAKALDNIGNAQTRREAKRFLQDTKPLTRDIKKSLSKSKKEVQAAKAALESAKKRIGPQIDKDITRAIKDLGPGYKSKGRAVPIERIFEEYLKDPSGELRALMTNLKAKDDVFKNSMEVLERLTEGDRAINTARKSAYVRALNARPIPAKKRATTVAYYEDGVKILSEVDPRVAKALGAINEQTQGFYERNVKPILSAPGRVFRFGTTGANPAFIIPNVIRDQFSSAIMSDKIGRQMAAGFGSVTENLKSLTDKGTNNPLYDQFSLDFSSGQFEGKLAADTTKAVDATLRQFGLKNKITPKAVLNKVEEKIGKASEEITRYQSYSAMWKTLKREGATDEQARFWAEKAMRENSIDFRVSGTWGKEINSILPYFNAAIQGSSQLAKTFAKRPATTAARVTGLVVIPQMALTAYNMADPERLQTYANIPDYEKEGNFIITLDGGRYIKFPMPPGFSSFTKAPRKFIEGLYGQDQASFNDIASSLVDPFVGPLNTDSAVSTVLPQGLKPTIQASANYDFFTGTPTDSRREQGLMPQDRFDENTSGLAKFVGEKFNVSPNRVDKFIRDTFGELGTVATGGRDIDESLSRRFTGADVQATVNEFYSLRADAEQIKNSYKARSDKQLDQGNVEAARIIREDANKLIDQLFSDFRQKRLQFVPEDRQEEVNEQLESLKLSTDMSIINRRRN